MLWNAPNLLTLLRIFLIPVFIAAYYLPFHWAPLLATMLFVLAALTDWLDGYLARRLNQASPFGAFLDPVADKLMVASALVLLTADPRVHSMVLDHRLFAIVVLIIIGREITVSACASGWRNWVSGRGWRFRFLGSSKPLVKWSRFRFCCIANRCLACLYFGSVNCYCTWPPDSRCGRW